MPKVYGIEHIIFLLIVILVTIAIQIFAKKVLKTDKQKVILVKIIAGILLVCICWNRYAISYYDNNYWKLLPDSFCGTSSMALALTILIGKKDNDFLHCICYVGFLGGLLTLAYPDFIGQNESVFFSKTISGLLHHAVMTTLIITTITTGYFKPTLKKWKCLVCGSAFYVIYGLFLINALGFNDAMTINGPLLDDTIFYWWFVGILFLILYFAGMLIYEYFRKKRVK